MNTALACGGPATVIAKLGLAVTGRPMCPRPVAIVPVPVQAMPNVSTKLTPALAVSIAHSSIPRPASNAAKSVFSPIGTNPDGAELPAKLTMSARRLVPKRVPSLTHGSNPCPSLAEE